MLNAIPGSGMQQHDRLNLLVNISGTAPGTSADADLTLSEVCHVDGHRRLVWVRLYRVEEFSRSGDDFKWEASSCLVN